MGMIIRVAFNNQGWRGKCQKADSDPRLIKCKDKIIDVQFKFDKEGTCIAGCAESDLCKTYRWHSWRGNFNTDRAQGNVIFVFPDINNLYVLFATSTIINVNGDIIYFERFNPFPTEKWVRGLTSYDLINNKWSMGTYRYIDESIEKKLNDLIG